MLTRQQAYPHLCAEFMQIIIVVLLVIFMAGCSSTRLAYRYADWGVIWWVEDYITLGGSQQEALEQGVRDFRQWHCSQELPRYEQWLNRVIADTTSAVDLDAGQVAFHQQQLLALLPPLTKQATPIAEALLQSLSNEQVQELALNMAKRQRELEQKLLKHSPEATASARAERTAERLQSWFGAFTDEQYFRIQTWSAAQAGQTAIWLDGRQRWQQALIDVLQQRQQVGFAASLATLLQQPEQARGLEYQQTMAQSQAAMTKLLSDLLAMGGTPAMAQVRAKAIKLKDDVSALACPTPLF